MAGFVPGSKPNLFNTRKIFPTLILFNKDIKKCLGENKFAWINEKIPGDFKTYKFNSPLGVWQYNLIDIDRPYTIQEATEACTSRDGWIPAKIEHSLTWALEGLSDDVLYRKSPVISLGSLRDFGPLDFIPATFFSEGTGKILDLFEEKDFAIGSRLLSVRSSSFS